MNLIDFVYLIFISAVWGLVFTISKFSKYHLAIKNDDIKWTQAETFTMLLQAWGIWTVKISLSILAVIGLGILVPSII